jgi:hypothetical protein
MHGRLAAKNIHIEELPLLVTPHPVNDLTPEQVHEMAQVAYPLIIKQLTGQDVLEQTIKIPYVHPAVRLRQARADTKKSGESR